MVLRAPAAGRSRVAPRRSPGPTLPVSPAGPRLCQAAPSPSRGPSSGSLAARVPGRGRERGLGHRDGSGDRRDLPRLPRHADLQTEAPRFGAVGVWRIQSWHSRPVTRGCPGTLARHGAGEELGDLGHPSQGRESGRGSGLGQGGPPAAFLEGALPGDRLEALEAVRSQALYGYLSVVSSCLKLSLSEWHW